jgi:hypothetical protein
MHTHTHTHMHARTHARARAHTHTHVPPHAPCVYSRAPCAYPPTHCVYPPTRAVCVPPHTPCVPTRALCAPTRAVCVPPRAVAPHIVCVYPHIVCVHPHTRRRAAALRSTGDTQPRELTISRGVGGGGGGGGGSYAALLAALRHPLLRDGDWAQCRVAPAAPPPAGAGEAADTSHADVISHCLFPAAAAASGTGGGEGSSESGGGGGAAAVLVVVNYAGGPVACRVALPEAAVGPRLRGRRWNLSDLLSPAEAAPMEADGGELAGDGGGLLMSLPPWHAAIYELLPAQ